MNKQTDNQLGTDPEDIEDVLKIIEKSYDIKFESNELAHIKTFGELTDYITSKIQLTDKGGCTTQQGFYKLRQAILSVKGLEGSIITVDLELKTVFPRQTRKREIRRIEENLGFKLNALRPRHSVLTAVLILLFISIALLFVSKAYGLGGILTTIGLFLIIDKLGIEFKDMTIGQLTERMTQRNYLKSRSNQLTVNKKEIEEMIRGLFVDELLLDKEELQRHTVIN